jgi:hypothetical protein
VNPVNLFVRGIKIVVSNLEMPLLLWLGTQLLFFLCLPLLVFLGAPALMILLCAGDRSAAQGMDGAVLLQSLADHWGWLLAGGLLSAGWLGLLLMAFLYLEAGILGCLAEVERSIRDEDLVRPHRLGYSEALRGFRLASLPQQIRRWGWPVTVLASLYSIPLLLMVLLFLAVAGGGLALVLSRPPALPFAVLSAGAVVLLFVPVAVALQLHFRIALLCAIDGGHRAAAAVRAATAAFRRRPWEVLGVFGLFFAASLSLSMASLVVGVPLTLGSLIPLLGIVLVPVRLFLSMAQMFFAVALWLAFMAALLPLVRTAPSARDAAGPGAEGSAPLPAEPQES